MAVMTIVPSIKDETRYSQCGSSTTEVKSSLETGGHIVLQACSPSLMSQMLHSNGQMVSSNAQMIPSHGQMLPSNGQMVSSHGQMLPSNAQMVSSHGQMLPSNAQMVPSSGQMVPSSGQMVPSSGQMVPSSGQMLPSSGQMVSPNGRQSSSPSSFFEVKSEVEGFTNSCSRQAFAEESDTSGDLQVELLTLSEGDSSLPGACTLPADRFSPTIIKLEDDFPNLSESESAAACAALEPSGPATSTVSNASSQPVVGISSGPRNASPLDFIKIEDDDYASPCQQEPTAQVVLSMADVVRAQITSTSDSTGAQVPYNTALSSGVQVPYNTALSSGVQAPYNTALSSGVQTPYNTALSSAHRPQVLPPVNIAAINFPPPVIKIEDDDKEPHVVNVEEPHVVATIPSSRSMHNEHALNVTSFNPPQYAHAHVNVSSPLKLAHLSIREPGDYIHNKNNENRFSDMHYALSNGHGHPSNPPPLISVPPHSSADDIQLTRNDVMAAASGVCNPDVSRRHSSMDIEQMKMISDNSGFRTIAGMESRGSSPDRPPVLITKSLHVPHPYRLMEKNGHRLPPENSAPSITDKSKYQVVITNGSSYKCEFCGKEFADFIDVCEHRKTHSSDNNALSRDNNALSPIKIEATNEKDHHVYKDPGKTIPPREIIHPVHNQQMIGNPGNNNYPFIQPPRGDEAHHIAIDPKQTNMYNPRLQNTHNFRIQTNCNIQANHVVYSGADHMLTGNVHGSLVMPHHAASLSSANKEHFFSKSYPPPNLISYEYQVPNNLSHSLRGKTNLFKPALRERSASSLDSYLSVSGQLSPHAYRQGRTANHQFSIPISPNKGRSHHMVDPHYYAASKAYMMANDHVMSSSQGIHAAAELEQMNRKKLSYQMQPRIIPNPGAMRPHPINHMDINRSPHPPEGYIGGPHIRQSGFAPPPPSSFVPPQVLHSLPENAAANIITEKQLATQRIKMLHNPQPVKFRGISDVTTRLLRAPSQVQPYYPPTGYPRNPIRNEDPPTLTKMPAGYPTMSSDHLNASAYNASLEKRQVVSPKYPQCDLCGKHFADVMTLKEHRLSHVNEQVIISPGLIKKEPDTSDYPSTSKVLIFRKDIPVENAYPPPRVVVNVENTLHSPDNTMPLHRSPVNQLPVADVSGPVDNQADAMRTQGNPDVENMVPVVQQGGSSPRAAQQQHFMQNYESASLRVTPPSVDSSQARILPNALIISNNDVMVNGNCPPPIVSDDTSRDSTDMPNHPSMHDPLLTDNSMSGENGGFDSHSCNTCGRTFDDFSKLKEHRKLHVSNKQISCGLCDKTFTQNSTLKRHQRTHTREKPYKCEICGKSFSHNYNLKEHGKTHTGEKPYKCEICWKTFAQNYHLKEHMTTHSDAKPFKCDKCNKTFSLDSYLKKHQKIHTGEKPYKCDVCEKQFLQNSHLKDHRRIHTGEKPFKCEICGIRFSQNYTLKIHQRTHTGEKPYKCEVCQKRFSQNSHLKEHRTRTHSGDKPFKCDQCHKEFSLDSYLKKHQKIHSGEKPFKCDICAKQFSQNYHLKEHRRIHTGEKPYKCQICEMRFSQNCSLKIHQRIHTGEKPYECEICGKQFSHSSNVKTHKRVHLNEKAKAASSSSQQSTASTSSIQTANSSEEVVDVKVGCQTPDPSVTVIPTTTSLLVAS